MCFFHTLLSEGVGSTWTWSSSWESCMFLQIGVNVDSRRAHPLYTSVCTPPFCQKSQICTICDFTAAERPCPEMPGLWVPSEFPEGGNTAGRAVAFRAPYVGFLAASGCYCVVVIGKIRSAGNHNISDYLAPLILKCSTSSSKLFHLTIFFSCLITPLIMNDLCDLISQVVFLLLNTN